MEKQARPLKGLRDYFGNSLNRSGTRRKQTMFPELSYGGLPVLIPDQAVLLASIGEIGSLAPDAISLATETSIGRCQDLIYLL